ncbi:UPF0481 protein At3g47200-like [Magnolia sinica]|uniref:UPF0481 protein At3g47200-like n=1 Tax=Magnolia sinica TaxID=86752 RepID=UPI00265A19B1|nr:UPF0481 protein At3g47200-like [Magnolia sinica]
MDRMDKTHTSRWAALLGSAGAVRNPRRRNPETLKIRCEAMREVHRQQGKKKTVHQESYHSLPIRDTMAASFMDDTYEIEVEANTSTNASPRRRILPPGRQALANSMMKSINASVSKLRHEDPPTIYIVPRKIRQIKNDAYEPDIVSIGPYHHGKKNLQRMEEHKWRYLHSILSRNPNHRLEDYLEAIEELEDKARSCYSDNVGPQMGNEFVKMMVLDGCFIVELFLKLKEEKEDPIFSTIWMLSLIGYDMLLLENQIPFFVLQRIFKMACTVDELFLYSLPELALDFFKDFLYRNKEIPIMDSYHHLLHLLQTHVIPTGESYLPCNHKVESIPNKWRNPVKYLRSKGVKLKKKEKWSSILDVEFKNGVLEIPPLQIDGSTNTLFRNLVAFEQCYSEATICFTTYVSFMDCIINTSKDVALLYRNGIMDNMLGSDQEVAHLFNQLCIGTFDYPINYLSGLYCDVQKHCNTKWNLQWASLRRNYFTNPWASLSSIAAVILILVTIAQTFYTVYTYHRPSS